MLNITNNKVSEYIDIKSFKSGKEIFTVQYHKRFKKFLKVFSILIVVIVFLPWTQNISSTGLVTTLKPNQRPQSIQSQIPGRVEEWFVQEGDFVKKGDTIIRISEVKSDYFDSRLAERTGDQLSVKSSSVEAYKNKVVALGNQISALQQERRLKLESAKNKLLQSRLKVTTDSMDFEATKIKADIAKIQYERTISLQEEGLKAVKDVEEKRAKLQEADAKLISQQNKYLSTKNELINAQIAISTISATYGDKLAKAQSGLYTAQSSGYDTEAEVSKLETSLANYTKRTSLLFVTAPQDGYINKAIKAGIGETFKEGEQLVSIMPADYDLAVEMYVRPIDLPLIHTGENVRVQFDGWPAIVFSGWPNVSYGTYGAKIVAIENYISSNGKYRVLLKPDADDVAWPEAIRVGSGAKSIALLNDVPIWFELWRQINSFPPDFYKPDSKTEYSKDKK
ncbi:HlyD family secretion protein [Algibacter lectus]|uniref:Multidrug resistance efflux pump n=1 Tax=Algibacter lectus TaxID=221126 RepID=A0A090VC98_9FLAO|nr:biotin/lipoyl-binding protein [Algibacter lectus]MWW23522.1 HlyD family efflux transporter periplasmic adaptor subunit [Algibacter lectus]TDY63799.1 multidrug resistance efflux pump [Algibacter lectus]GAL61738.1 RND efflux membrane fusion protein [Algibacter lectus]SFC29343.1 Multidrug resistance efflux pump [Algibacter lectus]